jgi:very-short-patch-repair endonuclease
MTGASFRRQTPIGPYVVDFVCHAAKLVVEIDGGQHFVSKHEQRDARRDAYLAAKGFDVLRFNNHDVMTNRQGVLETIAAAIERAPSLSLPRKRGRDAGAPPSHSSTNCAARL